MERRPWFPSGPAWMRKLLGDEFFAKVYSVDLQNDEGLEHLRGLTNLEVLGLWGPRVTDAGLEHLKKLTRLRHLALTETQVTDAGLKHLEGLTNLEWLDLTGTQVTDAGLEHLSGLTNLKTIHLYGTQVAVKMQRFRKQEAAVKVIREGGGFIVYDYEVGSYNKGNRPRGSPPGPAWTRKLLGDDFFAKVILAGVNSGEDLEPLKGLPNLESLEIIGWEEPITAAGLEHLKKLTNLRMLNLPLGSLSDDDLEELQQALPSCEIMHPYSNEQRFEAEGDEAFSCRLRKTMTMTDKPKRRWYQYSLRTLFVVMVLFAIACSWLAVKMQRVRKREEAVKAIREAGGFVWYDYEWNGAPGSPPGPAWMRKLLGENFFAKVVAASVKSNRSRAETLENKGFSEASHQEPA